MDANIAKLARKHVGRRKPPGGVMDGISAEGGFKKGPGGKVLGGTFNLGRAARRRLDSLPVYEKPGDNGRGHMRNISIHIS